MSVDDLVGFGFAGSLGTVDKRRGIYCVILDNTGIPIFPNHDSLSQG